MRKGLLALIFALLFLAGCGTSADTEDSGNTGNSGNTVDTGDSTDTGDTVDTGDSGNSADTGNSGDSADSGDSTDTGDSADTGTPGMISRIRKGEFPEGSTVSFDAVVTAVVFNTDKTTHEPVNIKGVFVSELVKTAQPWTGIFVFFKSGEELGTYAEGDHLDISGAYKVYYGQDQIEAGDVSKLGTADIPAPAEISDPSKIATPFVEEGGEWNPGKDHGELADEYMGVLVKVSDVTVTNENLGHGNWEITGNLAIDKYIFYYKGNRSNGTQFNFIQGILVYSYDAFRLAPRKDEDVSPKDSGDTGDSGDSADTGDTSDTGDTVTPGPVGTIPEIYEDKFADKAPITLEKVMVLSPAHKHSGSPTTWSFFVGTGQQEDHSGILIYKVVEGNSFPYETGDWLSFKGAVGKYDNSGLVHYQLQNAGKDAGPNEMTKLSDPAGTPPAAIQVSDADLMDFNTAEKYRGSLVTVGSVTVKTASDKYGTFVLNSGLQVSAYFLPKDANSGVKAGDTFGSITGIFDIHYGKATIHPLSTDDLQQ